MRVSEHEQGLQVLLQFTSTNSTGYGDDTYLGSEHERFTNKDGVISSTRPISNMRFAENPSIIKRICLKISRGFTNCGIFNNEECDAERSSVDGVSRSLFFLCNCCAVKQAKEREEEFNENYLSRCSEVMDSGRNISAHYLQLPHDENRLYQHSDNFLISEYKTNENQEFPGTSYFYSYGESSGFNSYEPCDVNNVSTRRSMDEEEELKAAPWFQEGIPRELMLEVLRQKPVGSFIVREATTKPECFALSVRVPYEMKVTGIAHYLIIRTTKGYKIKGSIKEFKTLSSLVTHHSIMPEFLPCPLLLERQILNRSSNSCHNRDFETINNDQDYDIIGDIRQMLEDIKV